MTLSDSASMGLGLVAYAAAHPLGVLGVYLGLRYAPAVTFDLARHYLNNTVRYMGANIRDTGKVLYKHGTKPRAKLTTPRGSTRYGGVRPISGTALTLLLFAPEIYTAYKNPSLLFQEGGVRGSGSSGGWFFGFKLEMPDY